MRNITAPILLMFLMFWTPSLHSFAQEENDAVVKYGTTYVHLKIKALDKYNSRLEYQQNRLIKKLKKKERHLANHLQATDSLAYANYKLQSAPSFDSINKLSQSDTGVSATNFSKRKNGLTDSLTGIASFVQSRTNTTNNSQGALGQNAEISRLQGQLNFRAYITQIITQRTNSLNSLSTPESTMLGITGIDKEVYYTKAKMSVFKEIEEDPTLAESKALEYLQGTEGFDNTMNNATQGSFAISPSSANGGNLQNTNPAKTGFTTNSQMQQQLQQKFGASLPLAANRMSNELNNWQDKIQQLQKNINDVESSGSNLLHTNKPIFKVNPMRGLPFRKRIEKQYSCQTIRPNSNSGTPTLIQPCIMIGFKHTLSLTYGIGLAGSFGLGQNWQNIHFSFQGIGLRTYASWLWQYGLGAYAGYERMYKQFVFTSTQQQNTDVSLSQHNTLAYQENILIGFTKNYAISKKYDGQIQALYNIWWQQDGSSSPIIIRVSFINK